jgi:hypothetical protein
MDMAWPWVALDQSEGRPPSTYQKESAGTRPANLLSDLSPALALSGVQPSSYPLKLH